MSKYYLIQNFGYDGLMITQFDNLLGAEYAYKDTLRRQKAWDEKYPGYPFDKGLIIIRGDVVVSDHKSEILN